MKIRNQREEQRQKEQALQEWLQAEQLRKAELEEMRLAQLEKERAILERTDERIRIRKHYAHLKELRILEIEAAAKELEMKLEAERYQAEVDEKERLLREEAELREENIRKENQAMAEEEERQRKVNAIQAEMACMEYEDALSYANDQAIQQREARIKDIEALCKIVYEPFEPIKFRHRRAKLPSEMVLEDDFESNRRINFQKVNRVVAIAAQNESLKTELIRKMNTAASVLTLSHESSLSRQGLHSLRRNKLQDGQLLQLISKANQSMEDLFLASLDKADRPRTAEQRDFYYEEASRPGLRATGVLESIHLPEFAGLEPLSGMVKKNLILPAIATPISKRKTIGEAKQENLLVQSVKDLKTKLTAELAHKSDSSASSSSAPKIVILGSLKPLNVKELPVTLKPVAVLGNMKCESGTEGYEVL